MQVSKPQALMLQTAPIQIGSRAFLGVSLGVGFRLSDPRILCHEAFVWDALSKAPQSVALNEAALPKRHAEWLLAGHAVHAVPERELGLRAQWACSVELAGVKKQVQCRAVANAPAGVPGPHYARLLLDHSNSWCGAAQENPCGSPQELSPLQVIASRDTATLPLSATGALDMRWPQRVRYRPAMYATVEEASTDGSHLGWPAHTDLRYFQQAAPDQWLQAGQWPPGAPYVLRGLGPRGEGFVNALPLLQPQAVCRDRGSEVFRPLAFAQQSVWFLPDADMGVMWWYGQTGLDYPLEDRVDHLVAALRGARETLDAATLAEAGRKRSNIKEYDIAGESDHILMPRLSDGWTWQLIESADDHPHESPQPKPYADLRKGVDAQQEFFVEVGIQQQAQQSRFAELPKPKPAAPVVLAAQPDVWQQRIAAIPDKLLRNALIEGQNLRQQKWSGWTFENVVFKHCDLGHSRVEDCTWTNVRLEQCTLEGAVFAGLHWKEGGLTSCHAGHMVWDNVHLQELSLVASDMASVCFSKGAWDQVSLVDLYGNQGEVNGVQWQTCSAQDCNLPDWRWQHLKSTLLMLVRCHLPRLHVQRCHFDSMSAIEADLSASHWNVCRLEVAVFDKKTLLSHSHWSDCQVAQCCANGVQASHLQAVHCSFVDFCATHMQAPHSRWNACVFQNAQLLQACLREAVFEACALKEARLFGADLSGSRVRHSNLIGAQTSWALAPEPGHWHSNLTEDQVDLPRRRA